MKVALYTRVSTKDQHADPQLKELRETCAANGWMVVEEYTDTISGSTLSRDGLDRLLADAKAGKFSAIVCVKIDRIARSLSNFLQITSELESLGVALIVPGQGINTSDRSPCGKLQRQLLAAVAEFEKSIIRERCQAGIDVAKVNGVKLGKPSKNLAPEPERSMIIRGWQLEGGRNVRELAKRLGGVSTATAHRLSREIL